MKNKILIFMTLILLVNSVSAYDDLMNYVRGTVFLADGSVAGQNVKITIRVDSGVYEGSVFITYVDSQKVFPQLHGRGFYSTNDQLIFDTGEKFTIIASNGTHYDIKESVFESPGTGMWASDKLNLVLNKPIRVSNEELINNLKLDDSSSFQENKSSFQGEIVIFNVNESRQKNVSDMLSSNYSSIYQNEDVDYDKYEIIAIVAIISIIIMSIVGLVMWFVKKK